MPEQAQLTGTATDLHLFVPITRVDDEARVVEGYCFVNETVDGEGGIRLMRSAMEEATEDYMRWGAVREMHQASAVGTALADGCGITWDEKGAMLRAKIVDEAAWRKVKEGVYRGFSLGARPKVTRGRDVTKVAWVENSLVDRPRDPDCPFTLFRVEGADAPEPAEAIVPAETPEADAAEALAEVTPETWARGERVHTQDGQTGTVAAWQGEYVAVQLDGSEPGLVALFTADFLTRGEAAEVEETPAEEIPEEQAAEEVPEPEETERAATSATVPSRENLEGGAVETTPTRLHGEMHYDCGSKTCHGHKQHAAAVRCAGMERADEGEEFEFLSRLAELETENTDLLQRLDTLETDLTARDTELADVRRKLSAADERVKELAKEPLPIRAVAPGVTLRRDDRQPAERVFAANSYDPEGTQGAEGRLLQRYAELSHLPPDADQAANDQRATEMLQLRETLKYGFGIALP